ncbi:MAG: AAA family ATPase [Proteobacteria bacterium]|nr:AAA family ATPase [Pseudomonadota bacterium]MCP4917211.1 AAA family ATPase [Pseudomonadota bacterium]
MQVDGYRELVELRRNRRSTTFRACRNDDGASVVVKIGHADAASALQAEFELLRDLEVPGVAEALALVRSTNGLPGLVTADAGPMHLGHWRQEAGFDLELGLRLAVQAAEIVGRIHRRDIVHLDLCPQNIVIDPDLAWLTVIDFARASRAPSLHRSRGIQGRTAGGLRYIAPEQTGRMNRRLDRRADLYSLGAVLYELLTGRAPFVYADGLEMVHAHLARPPTNPCELESQVPEVLGAIVLRLLEKTPEDRYQTAEALQADLLRAQRSGEDMAVFDLGRHDAATIRFGERLYGREDAFTELKASLAASRAAVTTTLVVGPEGMGKTALLHSLRDIVSRKGGTFLCGEFGPHNGDEPYAAIASALRGFVRRLAAGPPEVRDPWIPRLNAALDGRQAALDDLDLGLQRLLGMAPALPRLSPERAGFRFQLVLHALVKSLCRPDQPLVLAFDDLHRADPSTLSFVRSLARDPSLQHLLLLCASEDPMCLDGDETVRIDLEPLRQASLMELCADAMQLDEGGARALSNLLHATTHGNPQSTRLLLARLHSEDLLRFDSDSRTWTWDVVGLGERGLSANVDELLDVQIAELPPITLRIVRAAACLGTDGRLDLLAELAEIDADSLGGLMGSAIEARLVLGGRRDDPDEEGWHFAHDRVRMRALASMPRAMRDELEERAAALRVAWGQGIFRTVDHLNAGGAGGVELARMNADAARRARALGAPEAAFAYQQRVLTLREPTAQDVVETLRCAWLAGQLVQAQLLTAQLADLDPEFDVAPLAIRCHVRSRRYTEAMRWAPVALEKLGRTLPDELDRAIAEAMVLVRDADARTLLDVAPCIDDEVLHRARVLRDLARAAQHTDAATFTWLQLQLAVLSLEHGAIPGASHAWAWTGAVLASRLDDPDRGWELGRLGHELASRAEASDQALALFTFATHLNHWRMHLHTNRQLLQDAARLADEAGEAHLGAKARAADALVALSLGLRLDEVLQVTRAALEYAVTALPLRADGRSRPVVDVLTLLRQVVLALQGRTFGPGVLHDAGFRLSEFLEQADLDTESAAVIAHLRLLLAVHVGQWAEARTLVAELPIDGLSGSIQTADVAFHAAITSAGRDDVEGMRPHREFLAARCELCPANFRHRLWLVDAEIARLEGEHVNAVELFDRAIDTATEQGFTHDETLATARAGAFHAERGWTRFAAVYREATTAVADRWGRARPRPEQASRGPRPGGELDLISVLQAAEAISSEVELDALLDRLMRVCLQAAGANRGVLMLEQEDGGARMRVIGTLDGSAYRVELVDQPVDESSAVSVSAVDTVRASWDPVVIDDAQHEAAYVNDPHIQYTGVKSLLVLPIQRQSTLIGVFTLENTLVSHAFTQAQVGVLELLSSQIAISLAQSLMFEQLMGEIRERTLAEKALRRSELKYQSLYEHAPDVFVLWDAATRRVAQCNETTERLLGLTPRQLVGRPVADLFHPTNRDALRDVLSEFDREGRIEGARLLALRDDGTAIPVLVNASAVREGRRVLYCQAVLRDITQLEAARAALEGVNEELEERVRQRTRQLRDTNAELEGSNNELRQFAYLASHDLKSPIRRVASYLQLVQRKYGDELDPGAIAYMDKAIESAVRMQALIDDVLAFSQVGRDRRPPTPISASAALGAALDNLTEELAECEATVTAPPDLPMVVANESRLVQLFQNLVGNAVKYRADGRAPSIQIIGAVHDGHAEFTVVDNGIGFDMNNSRRIFTIFKRLHNRRDFSGNGIGLAICKKIVEMHGGKIWADSVEGEGSRFHFTLPTA